MLNSPVTSDEVRRLVHRTEAKYVVCCVIGYDYDSYYDGVNLFIDDGIKGKSTLGIQNNLLASWQMERPFIFHCH